MSDNPENAAGLKAFLAGNYVETLGLIPMLTLLLLLAFIVRIDRYIRADFKKTMRIIILTVFSLIVQNFLDYRLAEGEVKWLARTLVSIYGYAIRPVILILFLRVIAPEKHYGWAWALAGVNAAVNATALFSHLCFWIDEHNHFQGGPLKDTCLIVSAALLIYSFALTIRVFTPRKRQEAWVPLMVMALIAGAIELDSKVGPIAQPITYLTISIVISCVAYYIWLHLQFVREHEEALVAGQRVQLTISQIKPHFLYNTLNAIAALCDKYPQQVKHAIHQFARYLRGNMDSLDQQGPIPFTKELEHTKTYLEIEQLRFEDALQVRYDIACTDFRIPALTMEPLVENAVRHGVRGNKGGRGTVSIATLDAGDHFEVIIADDGPGFDPAHILDDGKPHVGLTNVRERLAVVCHGTLSIRSGQGEGTTATIILPKEQEIKAC